VADPLIDGLAGLTVPAEWRARQVIVGDETEIVTGLIPEVQSTRDLLLKFYPDTADELEIVGTVNQWRKERPDGSWLTSYFFKVRPREQRLDLPALYAAARRSVKSSIPTAAEPRTTVVVLSDAQIGKVGSRGGTPELLVRLEAKRDLLSKLLKQRKPSSTVLLDPGDLIENFESGGNPMFTNDLSLTQQLDVAATEIYEYVKLMAPHGHVDVATVPSNHSAWRRGKQELGRPADDFGLYVHRTVSKLATERGFDATWYQPAEYDESVVVNVHGTGIGVVHGHRSGRGKIVDWWAAQQHGGQPVGAADVLVTGHFHQLVVMPTGRNPYTGRSKWWLQAPTLDNGSDWFRAAAGEDSDPGLLVFDVTPEGFDLQSLTVL
jgi:hypothetical protein